MKRHWVLALAALAFLPGLAAAQTSALYGPRLRITPYVGVSPGFSQKGLATVLVGTEFNTRQYELDYNGSFPVGVNAELRFWNRFGVMVGGAWSRRSDLTLIDSSNTDSAFVVSGTDFWLAKADLAVHLAEGNSDMQLHRIQASLFAGPVFVRDRVRQTVFTPEESKNTINQWGLNLGMEAEVPTPNPRLALVLGAENSLIFWDNNKNSQRLEGYLRASNPDAAVLVTAKKSYLLMGRVGLSFRF